MSELSCEYFHSTHLACWFGQMLTKAISWMKSLIARPTPRGVPVSPARSRILVTCFIYASATRNKSPRASLRRSKSYSFRTHITHFAVIFPPSLLSWVSSYATLSAVLFYRRPCNKLLSSLRSTLYYIQFSWYFSFVTKILSTSEKEFFFTGP